MADAQRTPAEPITATGSSSSEKFAQLHSRIGWWSLLVFVTLGIFLESLHAFKVSWYLNVGEETRRLLWRLAHAHGAFLALVNIAFSVAVQQSSGIRPRWRPIASGCLIGATFALPAGFFLGGTTTYGGDPGPGIVLLPLGAALLWTSVLLTACRWPGEPPPASRSPQRKRRTKARKN